MSKMKKIISVISILAMIISTFNFTVLAENEITITNAQPYTYEISPALTEGRYKITTTFELSAFGEGSFPEQGILVKDSSDNTICGLKLAPYEDMKFSVVVGTESRVIHLGKANDGGVSGFGIYTLEMTIDIDSDTVMYTLSGDENVAFKDAFYGYFELSDGKLTTKRPIPLGMVSDLDNVSFYRNSEGSFKVYSLDIAKAPAESIVTYVNGTGTGKKSIKEIGLDDSYSYKNKVYVDGTSYDAATSGTYTVKYVNDCISVTGGTGAKQIAGVTKKFDAVTTGSTVVIKTGFYSGTQEKTDTGFGTAIRLYDSGRTNASYCLAVGKTGTVSEPGAGVAMIWDGIITANNFDKKYVVLNRNSAATLEKDTWYDLTLEIKRTSDTSATITATMEWDVPTGVSEYTVKDAGLVISNGKATLTKSGTATNANIDSIELLQSTAGSSYAGSTSKFSKVFVYDSAAIIPSITLSDVKNENGITIEEGNTVNPKEETLTFNFSDDVYMRAPYLLVKKDGTDNIRVDAQDVVNEDGTTNKRAIKATLEALDGDAEYELVLEGVYNGTTGSKISIIKNIKTRSDKTADNKVTAVPSAPDKASTGVTYTFTVANENDTEKKITAFIIQYSQEGMIKEIEQKEFAVGANSTARGSDTQLSLTYVTPANGDMVRAILIESLSFENGLEFHPILEMNNPNSNFNITISE